MDDRCFLLQLKHQIFTCHDRCLDHGSEFHVKQVSQAPYKNNKVYLLHGDITLLLVHSYSSQRIDSTTPIDSN